MKLFTPFTSLTALTASCVFVENVSARLLAGDRQVVARVRVTGSDDGYCAAKGLPPGCDANYKLLVEKFTDGKVEGILQDGGIGVYANIDCLKIIDDEKNGDKIAIASGLSSANSFEGFANKTIYVGAKIDASGKGYYSNSGNIMPKGKTCEDNFNYGQGTFKWYKHETGRVEIEEA